MDEVLLHGVAESGPGRAVVQSIYTPAVALLGDDAADQKEPTHLTFLVNFFDELRRRAPAGGK